MQAVQTKIEGNAELTVNPTPGPTGVVKEKAAGQDPEQAGSNPFSAMMTNLLEEDRITGQVTDKQETDPEQETAASDTQSREDFQVLGALACLFNDASSGSSPGNGNGLRLQEGPAAARNEILTGEAAPSGNQQFPLSEQITDPQDQSVFNRESQGHQQPTPDRPSLQRGVCLPFEAKNVQNDLSAAQKIPPNMPDENALSEAESKQAGPGLKSGIHFGPGAGSPGVGEKHLGGTQKHGQSVPAGETTPTPVPAAEVNSQIEHTDAPVSGAEMTPVEKSPDPGAGEDQMQPGARLKTASEAVGAKKALNPMVDFARQAMAGQGKIGLEKSTANHSPSRGLESEILRQVVARIRLSKAKVPSRASIRLEPASLGKLHVDLRADGHQVSIRMIAESHVVKDLLEVNMVHLRNELQQQGMDLKHVEVFVGRDGGGQRQPEARRRQKEGRKFSTAAVEEIEGKRPGRVGASRVSRTDGEVDTFV